MNCKKLLVLLALLGALLALPHSAKAAIAPLPEAVAALQSDAQVTITTTTVAAWGSTDNYYYSFTPTASEPAVGFIFYPGGNVDPRAYAPHLRDIAEAGFLVILIKMPGDFATSGRATEVIADFPAVKKWAIGGHSLGGVAAYQFINKNEGAVDGLVLWATYGFAGDETDIHDSRVKAVSLYGTNDGLSSVAEIEAGKPYLPPRTEYIEIEGGNHSYFGWYGTSADELQAGDNPADITREQQQELIVAATLDFLNKLQGGCPVIAALGEQDPGVTALRNFRDRMLVRTGVGRKLICLYYENADAMTAALERSPALKGYTRTVIRALLPLLP